MADTSDRHAVARRYADELFQIRPGRRYFAVNVGEHPRGAQPVGHGNHLATAFSEAEPVRGPRGDVHECAGARNERLLIEAELDLALDDIKGLVPRVAMRRRPAALRPVLKKDLVALGGVAGGQHSDALTG